MKSTFRRVVAAFSLVALVSVALGAPANAADTPTGVGSAGGTVTLLSVDLGNLLKAGLLGENNIVSIDPVNGTPRATETLSSLNVQSVAIPALNALSVPPVQTTSTGTADNTNTALLDLGSLGVPGVAGSINPASLTSLVDVNGAKAALNSTLANLNLAGVLGVDSASLNLSGLAGPSASNASRSVTADAISALDLQAVLNLLGLNLGDLSLQQVADLLNGLNELGALNSALGTNFTVPADLLDAVDALNNSIDTAQTALTTVTQTVNANLALLNTQLGLCSLAPPPADQVCIDAVNSLIAAQTALVTQAQGVLDSLQTQLTALLQGVVDTLSGTPLLAINGVSAGAVANAADTLANSAATVTGAINDIRVGGFDLGAVDANSTLATIQGVATQVVSTINGALATIDPSLANLLSMSLFQQATSLGTSGDYIQAVAGITAFALTITPPDICSLVNSVLSGTPISSLPQAPTLPASPVTGLLDDLGSVVSGCFDSPELTSQVQTQALPAGSLDALTGPVTFKAASVSSVSEFKVVPTSTTTSTTPTSPALPRTGANDMLFLVFGGMLAAVALGFRRVSAIARATTPRR